MIPINTVILADTVTKSGHGKIMKSLNRTVMTRHAIKGLPKHFEQVPETSPGGGGYRYKRRGREYSKREAARGWAHTAKRLQRRLS